MSSLLSHIPSPTVSCTSSSPIHTMISPSSLITTTVRPALRVGGQSSCLSGQSHRKWPDLSHLWHISWSDLFHRRQSDEVTSVLEDPDTSSSRCLKNSKFKSTIVTSNIVMSFFFPRKGIVKGSYNFDRDALNKQAWSSSSFFPPVIKISHTKVLNAPKWTLKSIPSFILSRYNHFFNVVWFTKDLYKYILFSFTHNSFEYISLWKELWFYSTKQNRIILRVLAHNIFHLSSFISVGLILLKTSSKPWNTRISRTEPYHNSKFYFTSNFSTPSMDVIISFVIFLFKLKSH
jgi:hypothetical protein